MRAPSRSTFLLALVALTGGARADWQAPITGANTMLPTRFEPADGTLTVHVSRGRRPSTPDGEGVGGWSQPLVDRRLSLAERSAPLDGRLLEAINRIEPIYDPTLLEGSVVVTPMHVSAGTAETRDIFGDRWRIASTDANVDAEARPIATAWMAGPDRRSCNAYRINRRHAWGEPALTALAAADCRAIRSRQFRGFADSAPIPVAIAAPPIPVFAAPEPGSRMSSAAFWDAQRARIAGIHAHLSRKWTGRAPPAAAQTASNERR